MTKGLSVTISEELWSNNKELACSSLNSTFIKGLLRGDLPVENFQDYIAQDSFFLEAFARAYGMAIAKSPDKVSITILSKMLSGVIEELKLHDSYSKEWNVDLKNYSINSTTKAYTDFLGKITISGSMAEIISAMTPCMRLYSWLGQSLNSKKKCFKNPYQDWINTYSDKSFEMLALSLEKLINSYYKKNELKNIRTLYKKAMQLEFNFFEAYSP